MKLTQKKVSLCEALTEHEAKVLMWLKRADNASELAVAALGEAMDTVKQASEDCIRVSSSVWLDLANQLDKQGQALFEANKALEAMGVHYVRALAKAHRDEIE